MKYTKGVKIERSKKKMERERKKGRREKERKGRGKKTYQEANHSQQCASTTKPSLSISEG